MLKRGLAGTATCSSACSLEIEVMVGKPGATARAASAAKGRAASAGRFRVKLSSAAKRKLRKARSAKLTVVVVARGADGSATTTRTVTVRR